MGGVRSALRHGSVEPSSKQQTPPVVQVLNLAIVLETAAIFKVTCVSNGMASNSSRHGLPQFSSQVFVFVSEIGRPAVPLQM